MIEIVEYEPEHIDEIMKNPREWELRLSSHPDWNEWKMIWRKNSAYTLMVDGKPIGSAGVIIIPQLEGEIGEAWMVVSNLMPKYRKTFFSAIKKYLNLIIKDWVLVGVQSFVDPTFDGGRHLMAHLGFEEDRPEKIHGMDMIRFWRVC